MVKCPGCNKPLDCCDDAHSIGIKLNLYVCDECNLATYTDKSDKVVSIYQYGISENK